MTYPNQQIPSTNPQNIGLGTPVGLQTAARAPTTSDNTLPPGYEWQNSVTGIFYKCVSSGIAGAVWSQFVPSGFSDVATLTGNSGGAVGGNFGNINVIGDGTTINIVGNPGTNTLTASLVGGGVASQSYVTNLSSPVVPTSAGVINLNTSTTTFTSGAVANTIKIELQGSSNALFIGRGANTAAATLPIGSTGQVLTSNGAAVDPSWQTANAFFTFTSVNHVASPYTVLSTDQFLSVDCSGGVVTIKLPNAPTIGRALYIKDSTGSALTNNISVTTVGGAVNIDAATTFTMNANYQSIGVCYTGSVYNIF